MISSHSNQLSPLPTLTYDPTVKVMLNSRGVPESGLIDFKYMTLAADGTQISAECLSNPPPGYALARRDGETLPPMSDVAGATVAPPKKIKKLTLIANLYGGGGRNASKAKMEALEFFTGELRRRGVEVTVLRTERKGHGVELVKTIALDEASVVGAWGGDGTLNEVVAGLMSIPDPSKRPPLLIVPCGSGNALANMIYYKMEENVNKIPLKERLSRCVEMLTCETPLVHAIDVGKLTPLGPDAHSPIHFTLIFGWGDPVSFIETSEWLRKKFHLGGIRQALTVLYRIAYKNYPRRPRTRMVVDDEFEFVPKWDKPNGYLRDFSLFTIAGIKLPGSGYYQTSPVSSLDDGKFEAILTPALALKGLQTNTVLALQKRRFVGSKKKKMPSEDTPLYLRFSKLRVELVAGEVYANESEDRKVMVDGEVYANCFPFEVECEHAAVRLVLPR